MLRFAAKYKIKKSQAMRVFWRDEFIFCGLIISKGIDNASRNQEDRKLRASIPENCMVVAYTKRFKGDTCRETVDVHQNSTSKGRLQQAKKKKKRGPVFGGYLGSRRKLWQERDSRGCSAAL